jgi:hypothetical protein
MLRRIKQGLRFLFGRYDEKNNELVKEILSPEEYTIFLAMGEYDRVHSLNILKEVMKDEFLKDDENYLKLALLHDCGKGKAGIFSRIKVVSIGGKTLKKHPGNSWDMLKEINLIVAGLASKHHTEYLDEKMKKFQEIDDRN